MALYALGDLHLSLNSNKSMEIFGDGWQDYVLRLKEAFSALRPEDVTVLCGDLSWGMSLEESAQGQPRLLVEHRRQDGAVLPGA